MNDKCQIVWNLTSKCNECCKFCFRKKCKDISLIENKKIVDKISNWKIETLSLSGGEALMYKGIFELVEYIKLKLPNTKLVLNTNGKNIDEDTLERIINEFNAITLSIDSLDCHYNEQIGRGYKHIKDVLKIIEFCNNKIKIKINTVIINDNIREIEDIYDLIKKYDIVRWKIFRFLPVRDAQKYIDDFSIDDNTSKKIENYINVMNSNSSMEISYNKGKNYKTKYFIYPDGTIENNKLEQIGNLLEDDN
jgi:MoaA/NifB/PqqE/SkfB family radical SAM enzyme